VNDFQTYLVTVELLVSVRAIEYPAFIQSSLLVSLELTVHSPDEVRGEEKRKAEELKFSKSFGFREVCRYRL